MSQTTSRKQSKVAVSYMAMALQPHRDNHPHCDNPPRQSYPHRQPPSTAAKITIFPCMRFSIYTFQSVPWLIVCLNNNKVLTFYRYRPFQI